MIFGLVLDIEACSYGDWTADYTLSEILRQGFIPAFPRVYFCDASGSREVFVRKSLPPTDLCCPNGFTKFRWTPESQILCPDVVH